MISVRSIRKLQNNDGMTLKGGRIITYRSGWQVADYGKEATTPEEAIKLVKEMEGNCGVWFADGIYYIDHSFRVATKAEAIAIGRTFKQISVWGWRTQRLAYC